MEPDDPLVGDWESRVRASFAAQSLMQTFHARIATLEPGRCVIEADYAEGLGQQTDIFTPALSRH